MFDGMKEGIGTKTYTNSWLKRCNGFNCHYHGIEFSTVDGLEACTVTGC